VSPISSSSRVHSFRVEFGGDHFGPAEAETTADVHIATGMDGAFSAAVDGALRSDDAHRRDALPLPPEWVGQLPALDRRASPTVNGLMRSGQLASLPPARGLSVVRPINEYGRAA
jgi:hypothetical protein